MRLNAKVLKGLRAHEPVVGLCIGTYRITIGLLACQRETEGDTADH
eukprot:CAMPEP_0115333588 /NCGR_PEP_ID=MMETSP0270-20121206/87455_1 /TAXON_ID=71861 /ORGANISM="Scrippsiella trochoidea, Strain CCMP3099" /LENGTH=45 /DNA_ID= /DNA_START= /DNA_END= /DNA_ORIENTATION=